MYDFVHGCRTPQLLAYRFLVHIHVVRDTPHVAVDVRFRTHAGAENHPHCIGRTISCTRGCRIPPTCGCRIRCRACMISDTWDSLGQRFPYKLLYCWWFPMQRFPLQFFSVWFPNAGYPNALQPEQTYLVARIMFRPRRSPHDIFSAA